MSVLIAPSILSANFARLGEEIAKAENGGADWIHVDVMDGHFVPNITIGVPVVKSIRGETKLPIDVHLMIENPDNYLDEFAKAGADYITVHEEACTHLHRTLSHIRKLGKKAGVALNPHTREDVLEFVVDELDLVLIMTVNPGFGGQSFIKSVVPKIKRLRKLLDDRGRKDCLISVDGGIANDTAYEVASAGANVLVAGTSVYKAPSIPDAIRDLKLAADGKLDAKASKHGTASGDKSKASMAGEC